MQVCTFRALARAQHGSPRPPDPTPAAPQGVDGRLCAPGGGPEVSGDLISAVTTAVLEFVSAVAAGKMEACGLQRAKGPEDGPPEGPALQALQAAQVRLRMRA